MKNFIRIILITGLMVSAEAEIQAQRNGGRHKRRTVTVRKVHTRPAKVVHVHKVRFSRAKVVVVRKRQVRTVVVMPAGYTTVTHRSVRYRYHEGYYYRPKGNVWIAVAPPAGLRIRLLPIGYHTVQAGGATYYYSTGIYYKPVKDGYEVLEPPSGAVIPVLPEDNEEITIEGITYYEYNGYLYRATDDGKYTLAGRLED